MMSSPTSATTVARNPGENNAKRDFADFGKSDTVMEGEDPVTITDPSCCASLIFNGVLPSGDEALISIPYPFSNFEPKTIELDEGAAAALASGMEDTNPLDYSAKSHSLLATPRAFISTDRLPRAKRARWRHSSAHRRRNTFWKRIYQPQTARRFWAQSAFGWQRRLSSEIHSQRKFRQIAST